MRKGWPANLLDRIASRSVCSQVGSLFALSADIRSVALGAKINVAVGALLVVVSEVKWRANLALVARVPGLTLEASERLEADVVDTSEDSTVWDASVIVNVVVIVGVTESASWTSVPSAALIADISSIVAAR